MNFSEWLLILEAGSRAVITVKPDLRAPVEKTPREVTKWADAEEIEQIVRKTLMAHFQQLDPKGWRYAKERYAFHVVKAGDSSDAMALMINVEPIGVPDKIEDDGKWTFRTPKEAIDSIPKDPQFGYRGMSWEEWQQIERKGFVKSRGVFNLQFQRGDDEGYTYFGKDPKTGTTYAHAMAPWQYQISPRRPGVVIAIPVRFLKSQKDDFAKISSSELALPNQLEKEHIAHAWMLKAVSAKPKLMGLQFPWKQDWDHNKYKDPRTGFYTIDTENAMWMDGTNLSVKYSIRQMF